MFSTLLLLIMKNRAFLNKKFSLPMYSSEFRFNGDNEECGLRGDSENVFTWRLRFVSNDFELSASALSESLATEEATSLRVSYLET